jgi:hypothetical protein
VKTTGSFIGFLALVTLSSYKKYFYQAKKLDKNTLGAIMRKNSEIRNFMLP